MKSTDILPLYSVVAGIVLFLAACADISRRTIPDRLSIVLAIAGLSLKFIEGPMALASAMAAALLVFVAMALACMRGAMGGGDVKIATALALGLSPTATWHFVYATAIAGGLLAVAYFLLSTLLPAARRDPVAERAWIAPRRIAAAELRRIRRRAGLPYCIAIALGGLSVIQSGLIP